MGKRIASQARGKGGPAYRVRKKAYSHRLGCPRLKDECVAKVLRLISSAGHSAPIAKMIITKDKENEIFYIPAVQGLYEGQKVEVGGSNIEKGNIVFVKDLPIGTRISNIERRPGDGGKMVRTSGGFATVSKKDDKLVWSRLILIWQVPLKDEFISVSILSIIC